MCVTTQNHVIRNESTSRCESRAIRLEATDASAAGVLRPDDLGTIEIGRTLVDGIEPLID